MNRMNQPVLHRRDFISMAGLASVSLTLNPKPLAANPTVKRPKVGIQLVGLVSSCQRDCDGTLKELAAMGYEGVVFSSRFGGFFGKKPDEMRRVLAGEGLECVGWHVPDTALAQNSLAATLDAANAVGAKYVVQVTSAVGKENSRSKTAWLAAAEKFNRLAAVAAARDVRIGYHSEDSDFIPLDEGGTAWEAFTTALDPEILPQIDTFHVMNGGGGDPAQAIRRIVGRARVVHLREWNGPVRSPGAETHIPWGEGRTPWNEVFAACEDAGGTEWYVLMEYWGTNRADRADIDSARRNLDFMRSRERAKPAKP